MIPPAPALTWALRDAVVEAGWSALLPAHRCMGDDQPIGEPRPVDALHLGGEHWLVLVADEIGRVHPVPLRTGADGVRRSLAGEGTGEALVARLASAEESGAFRLTCWHSEPVAGERSIDVDQTNESLVVGDRAVLKWAFRAEAGPHPAPSLLSELERTGFAGTPRPWGVVEWQPLAGAPRLVASIVALVPGASDGWSWAVDDLRTAVTTVEPEAVRRAGTALGRLLADFHIALRETARPASWAEAARWEAEAVADLDRALAVAGGRSRSVLDEHGAEVRTALTALTGAGTAVMRVHGDLHVGQVLRSPDGYWVTDFDGNPVVPPAERLQEQPAAADVAGMLQSLRHVALVLRKHHPGADPVTVDAMESVLSGSFLESYRSGLADADQGALFDARLVRPFRLRQVCREFTYAATHLPRWSYVPEAALPALLQEAGR